MSKRTKIGISHGDINSISYEVIMKAVKDKRLLELCIPIIYGSPKVAAYHKKALNIEELNMNTIKTPDEASNRRVNIINCISDDIRVELGKSTRQAGEASFQALQAAVADLAGNKIDALVTGPINKQNIQSPEFQHSGHTEYLKEQFQVDEVLMLMVSDLMKVGVVAGHLPIAELPGFITRKMIISKLNILNESLQVDFGIRKPKIAVLGLNPHAGDEGLLGSEEQETITPAIQVARENDILAFGPFPADGFFGSGKFAKYDAVLAMYHDQGLIPFKTLTIDDGVNYTAGLPVIRTSPAHGTAYELAGKDEATHSSFLNAIYLACDIIKNRELHSEITKNPLGTGLTNTGDKDEDLPENGE